MFVFKAAVVGAGTMGGEIAQAIASADVPVVLKDLDRERVDEGVEKARSLWQAAVDAGKLEPAEMERRLGLITPTTGYEPFGDVDFVIEAVPERIEIKRTVFSELDAATPGHAILASNTSSLSITEIGALTTRPDKVVGFHFFYPASTNRLIEVTAGDDTSSETAQVAANFAQTIRKMPIRCAEAPGFVVNRISNAAVSELLRAQVESDMDVAELDRIVAGASASGIGPFYLFDLLGLDTVLSVSEYLNESLGDRFFVHEQMRELVAAGDLGVKTGKGFYEHRS